jgi:ribosomal protein S24E
VNLQIDEKRKNPLLRRDEIKFTVSSDKATSSKKEVEEALSNELGADKGLLIVKGIFPVYGTRYAKGTAVVYKSKEDMGIEKAYVLARKGLAPKKEEKKEKEPEKKQEKKGKK